MSTSVWEGRAVAVVGGEVEVAEKQVHVGGCYKLLLHQRRLAGQVDAVSDARVLAAVRSASLPLLRFEG